MTEAAAIIACLTLIGLSFFQLLLIAGRPLGRYAWGGSHDILPKHLRVASLTSILLYVVFAAVIIAKVFVVGRREDSGALDVAVWICTAYFFLGICMNAISRSKAERLLMTPVAAVLALTFLVAALQ